MTYTPGPKELALKALKENKVAKKPSTAQLRQQIAKTKPAKIGRKGAHGR